MWMKCIALACVAWRFCRAGRTSGEAAKFAREARENERQSREKKLLPPQSPRGFCALARLYYLARPTKTAMLRRLALPKKHNTATQPARARTQTCSLIRFQFWLKSKGTLSWSFLASNRRQIRSKIRSKIGFLPHTSHPWMLLAVKAVQNL